MDERSFEEFSVGSLIDQRYEVLEHLGSGAMGIVIRVFDRSLHSDQIALKILSPLLPADSKSFERFRKEVLAMRELAHENIVRIYDVGQSREGQLYVSMEYIAGSTLDDYIKQQAEVQSFSPRVIEILYSISLGMREVHQKEIVHRDLKASNVLLTPEGKVKIADFGLAHIESEEERLTRTGETLGTPRYMAPEQLTGRDIDARADIYSFGILGFELACGRHPFQAESYYALAEQHMTEALPNLKKMVSGVPSWFQLFIERCSAKAAEDRFQSFEEIVAYLESYLPDQHYGRFHGKTLRNYLAHITLSSRKAGRFFRHIAVQSTLFVFLFLCLFVESTRRDYYIEIAKFKMDVPLFAAKQVLWFENYFECQAKFARWLLRIDVQNDIPGLFHHIYQQQDSYVRLLLETGISADSIDEEGVPAIWRALQYGNNRTVHSLLDYGAKTDFRHPISGETVLMQAVKYHLNKPKVTLHFTVYPMTTTRIIDKILQRNASPQTKDYAGNTVYTYLFNSAIEPSIWFVRDGRNVKYLNLWREEYRSGICSIMEKLLKYDASPNSIDSSNQTPLMYARSKDCLSAIRLLEQE